MRSFVFVGRERVVEIFCFVVVWKFTGVAFAVTGDVVHAETIICWVFFLVLAGRAARGAATCGSVSGLGPCGEFIFRALVAGAVIMVHIMALAMILVSMIASAVVPIASVAASVGTGVMVLVVIRTPVPSAAAAT